MKVYVVGIGPGSREYILPKATHIIEKSDMVLGFDRAIKSLSFIKREKIIVNKLSQVLEYIEKNQDKTIAIVASGDPLFYGITQYIRNNYSGELEVIPGISSFQYMMSTLCMSWQGSFLGSLHGREDDFSHIVKMNKISIWLTDTKHSPQYMIQKLRENNINAKMYIGENLSYEDEKITEVYVRNLDSIECGKLCIVVVENLDLN